MVGRSGLGSSGADEDNEVSAGPLSLRGPWDVCAAGVRTGWSPGVGLG